VRKRLVQHASNRDASAGSGRQPEQPELGEFRARPGDRAERGFRRPTLPPQSEGRTQPEIADIGIGPLLQRRAIELGSLRILAVAIISVAMLSAAAALPASAARRLSASEARSSVARRVATVSRSCA
jgi:hypothetical protein